MPEPSFNNPKEWVRWHACWVETPAWWPELVKVPTQRDPISFAKWLQASFQFPKAKFFKTGGDDHTPLPAPYCMEWDAFLLQAKGNFASQDYRLRQPQKTQAFTKALQFWVEKAQPPQMNRLCLVPIRRLLQ